MKDRDTLLLSETYDRIIQNHLKNVNYDIENNIPTDDDIRKSAEERNKLLLKFKYRPLVIDHDFMHEAKEFLKWAIKEKEEFDKNHPDVEIKYTIWSFLNDNIRSWSDTGRGVPKKNTSVADLLVLLVEMLKKKKEKGEL